MLLGGRVSAAEELISADHTRPGPIAPQETGELRSLMEQLARAPRRRDFKTVPMILDKADWWDAAALDAVLAYKGGPKQSWDHTDLGGPWLNVAPSAEEEKLLGNPQIGYPDGQEFMLKYSRNGVLFPSPRIPPPLTSWRMQS